MSISAEMADQYYDDMKNFVDTEVTELNEMNDELSCDDSFEGEF